MASPPKKIAPQSSKKRPAAPGAAPQRPAAHPPSTAPQMGVMSPIKPAGVAAPQPARALPIQQQGFAAHPQQRPSQTAFPPQQQQAQPPFHPHPQGQQPPQGQPATTAQRVEMIRQYYAQLMANLRSVTMQLQQLPNPLPNHSDPNAQRRQMLLAQQERFKRSLQEFTERVMKPQAAAAGIRPPATAPGTPLGHSGMQTQMLQQMSFHRFMGSAAAPTAAPTPSMNFQHASLAQMQQFQSALLRQRQQQHHVQQMIQQQQQQFQQQARPSTATPPPQQTPTIEMVSTPAKPSPAKYASRVDSPVPSISRPSSVLSLNQQSMLQSSIPASPTNTATTTPTPIPNGPPLPPIPHADVDRLREADEFGLELIEAAIQLAKHRGGASMTPTDMLVAVGAVAGYHFSPYELDVEARIRDWPPPRPSAAEAQAASSGKDATVSKRSNTGPHMARMSQLRKHLTKRDSPPLMPAAITEDEPTPLQQ